MTKKQILTNAEIEKDIVDAIKNPPKESESSYNKSELIGIIVAILLIVIGFIYPFFILWAFLSFLAFVILYTIFYHIRLKNQIKNLTINNYDITTEIVHSILEEHYIGETQGSYKRHRKEQIHNYTVRFENGKDWRIPKKLYNWHERLRLQDLGIYNTTHRGDVFIVVTEKSTGKIVVAYNTDIFEYKN